MGAELQPDLFSPLYRLRLTADERTRIGRPIITGPWGGFQQTASMIQSRASAGGGVFHLTHAELDEIYSKGWRYGDGTYQNWYFRPAEDAGRRAGYRPDPDLVREVQAAYREIQERKEPWDRGC